MCKILSIDVILIVLCNEIFFNLIIIAVRFAFNIWFSSTLNCDSVYNDKGYGTLYGVVERVVYGVIVWCEVTVIK